MSKISASFFEEHIEKIVLAIVGLVCLWLLITRVVMSPNRVEYDKKNFGSGGIDAYINEQAKFLQDELGRKPKAKQPYKPRLDNFVALVNSSVTDVDVNLSLPQPNRISQVSAKRVYSMPTIGRVSDVVVEHIRAVAYVPTQEINEENLYINAQHEPRDIDLVTLEAKIDVAELCKSFFESFAGKNVREEWRDPYHAVPVFAAVQLERQELLASGNWSDWQVVPRSKVDHHKGLFEVPEDAKNLPTGGMKVLKFRFGDPGVRTDLLQPSTYKIASAEEEWFPPSLHKKYVELQKGLKAQEKRTARALLKETRDRAREETRLERGAKMAQTRPRPSLSDDMAMEGEGEYLFTPSPITKRAPARRPGNEPRTEERPEKTRDGSKPAKTQVDVYGELNAISITDRTDFTEMKEPLVFWAHDDTVRPEGSYRYRVRFGVFNPLAGTEQFSERDGSLKDKVILWSQFSQPTERITIPGMLYFFPLEVQEATKTVAVQVCRYALGYWHSKDFNVRQGEEIGKVVPSEPANEANDVTLPPTIDYSTGVILLDVVPVNDWLYGRNLSARHYFDMLYCSDGTNIQRIAIKQRYWPEELQAKYAEIKKVEKEPKQPLQEWEATRQRLLPGSGEGDNLL